MAKNREEQPEMESFNSSVIAELGWDKEGCWVRFADSGKLGVYPGVSETTYEEWRNSPSVGRFWNQFIKKAYAFNER